MARAVLNEEISVVASALGSPDAAGGAQTRILLRRETLNERATSSVTAAGCLSTFAEAPQDVRHPLPEAPRKRNYVATASHANCGPTVASHV